MRTEKEKKELTTEEVLRRFREDRRRVGTVEEMKQFLTQYTDLLNAVQSPQLEQKIRDLPLTTRLKNCLHGFFVGHVAQPRLKHLLDVPYSEIRKIRNMGPGTMRELVSYLDGQGITLPGERP